MRILKLAFLAMGVLLLWADAVAAQQQSQPPECQPWIGIKSWQVSVHISGSGSYTDSVGNSASLQESDDLQYQISVDPNSLAPCEGTWGWLSVQSPKENIHINASIYDASSGCRDDLAYSRANVDGGGNGLDMDFEKGTYYSGVGVVIGPTGNGDYWDTENYTGNCDPIRHSFYESSVLSYDPTCVGYDPSLLGVINGGLPASGALSGSATYICPSQAVGGLPPLNLFSWTITWSMTPTPANLDLVVTIPSYNTWRPTGGRTEKEVGTSPTSNATDALGVRAQLIDKDTGMPSYLIPDKVTFTLADVSQEPGVVMNWPPQGTATSDPDLTFDCEFNVARNGTSKVGSDDCTQNLEATGTQIEFDPEDDSNPVLATVSPHDWGGWATLNVTATVAGVAYQGSLDTDPGNTNILLPKRQQGSFIADSWKQGKVPLGTADSDDSEKNPNGNGQPGDGLTLYEEYRGFYMGCSDNEAPPRPEATAGATCKHVEGDPKKQDYFAVDHVGADQAIMKFGSAAGLKVHFQGLKCEEIHASTVTTGAESTCGTQGDSNLYRVLNFNTSAGPHEVPQHAIVINWGGSGDTSMVVTPKDYVCQDGSLSCPALPKHIDHVEITRAYLTEKTNDFDSIVAHELAHTVDVYHHGDIDHLDPPEFWTYDPATQTEKAIFGAGGIFQVTTTVSILLESSNLSSPDPADFDAASMSLLGLDVPLKDKPPKDQQGNSINGRYVYVGNNICKGAVQLSGQHSGDENSIMRYHIAQGYIPNGFPNYRIWIGPGSEAAGTILTNNPEGTGVNDPNRTIPPDETPRPRYGNAFAGRGNDLSQIAVNDNGQESRLPTQTCK